MSNFIFNKTDIQDVYLIEPKLFGDSRGYFMESYNKKAFEEAGLDYTFVQENQSCSSKGVLRGLHFQIKHSQAKLVRVLSGAVYDVAVDLRHKSPTYGKWVGAVLTDENRKQLLIPRGFAHGFYVMSDTAVFSYLCDDFYHPEDEGGVRYDDPELNIEWPQTESIIQSDKDRKLPCFKDLGIIF